MRSLLIVQLSDGTPTGLPTRASLIHGILGRVARCTFMKRSISVTQRSFAAVFPARHWIDGWRFGCGFSIEARARSWRITTAPDVDLAALSARATLVRDTGAPSQSQEMGAALGCYEANRGVVHAAPAQDIPVDLFSTLNDAETVQTPQKAGAARRDASISDEADCQPGSRSRRRRPLSRTGGAS